MAKKVEWLHSLTKPIWNEDEHLRLRMIFIKICIIWESKLNKNNLKEILLLIYIKTSSVTLRDDITITHH